MLCNKCKKREATSFYETEIEWIDSYTKLAAPRKIKAGLCDKCSAGLAASCADVNMGIAAVKTSYRRLR